MLFFAKIAVRVVFACCALGLAFPAFAETKKDKEKEKETANKPALVATYGDWSVYHSQSGKNRICYTLAMPKQRDPADLKRDPAYAFISERPAEQVRNEVSFVMGFEVGPGAEPEKPQTKEKKKDAKEKKLKADPTATVGEDQYDLLPKGSDLWVKNPAQESQLIDAMRKGGELKIRAPSKKGNVTVDTYSLAGFKQAIDRALKDCPGA